MLIVEGPDGSGKTTLVNDIKGVFGLDPELRTVSKDAVALIDLSQFVEDELRKGRGWRLYDRFALISSPNYCMLPNPTFQGKFLEPYWLKMMWHRFRSVSPVVIMCLPPRSVVAKNVRDSSDNLIVWQHIGEIWDHYHSMAAMMNWLVWDYTDPTTRGRIMNEILQLQYTIRERENRMNANGGQTSNNA